MYRDDSIHLASHLKVILEKLSSVTHMIEDEQPCNHIICQIESIQLSLRNLRCTLISCQIRESTLVILNNSDTKVRQRELSRLIDLYKEK